MTAAATDEWQAELGIDSQRRSKHFFANKGELSTAGDRVPQAHVLRRAFDLLKLDGVLCSDTAPLVYFRLVAKIESQQAIALHRDFWNHGGAPLFVLIDPWNVHIYSGLSRPAREADAEGRVAGFVDGLARASAGMEEFLPAVESGEFFRRHARSFDPKQRVDRDLLENLHATRKQLVEALERDVDEDALDALLCRLVFTCYLFDRGVIDREYLEGMGIPAAAHLRDVLAVQPRSLAKEHLYERLFKSLGEDFNGDLFSSDLAAEAELVAPTHVKLLDRFFRGTGADGQQSFWPYNFGVIPIETISAIYERFLKPSDRDRGAFYTPRFLAEVVLDSALMRTTELIGKKYLDPSCGSGVFLVGVFNRIAEEWTQAYPVASNDRRATALLKLLRNSIFGIDINPTACRITAFSLYLAYLDQLSPRGIREIQAKKGALPRLVACRAGGDESAAGTNIWCGDFFVGDPRYPQGVDFVIGNPPWGGIAVEGTPAAEWCAKQEPPVEIPDKQIAAAFMRKGPTHVGKSGRVCFVLPAGILFNHGVAAIKFQRSLLKVYSVDRVFNLADYQRFLFEEAGHPALVLDYRAEPSLGRHTFEYWSPKTNWTVRRAEVITVAPEDRTVLSVADVLRDLDGADAPQIWKRRLWATPRDWRLIDRLSAQPRLRDYVRQAKDKGSEKRWLMAEGFQPVGKGDDPAKAMGLLLPSRYFIRATALAIDLFLLGSDCTELPKAGVMVRGGSNKRTEIFRGPHVLVAQGFTSTAFADSDVSFQHALRGISGPRTDRELLIFLAAYLRSPLARYYLFHTSSNWGVSRQKVHVEELLRLPFATPDAHANPMDARKIVREVAKIVSAAAEESSKPICDRQDIVRRASREIDPLIDRYFDVLPVEKPLIQDTLDIIIPSVRPTHQRKVVPTIQQSDSKRRAAYLDRLCGTLSRWARKAGFVVKGAEAASADMGIAVAVLERSTRGERRPAPAVPDNLLATMDRLRKVAARKQNTFELARGVKAFDDERLYIVKPLGQRFWTQTAALNDADEIAGTILLDTSEGVAWA